MLFLGDILCLKVDLYSYEIFRSDIVTDVMEYLDMSFDTTNELITCKNNTREVYFACRCLRDTGHVNGSHSTLQ